MRLRPKTETSRFLFALAICALLAPFSGAIAEDCDVRLRLVKKFQTISEGIALNSFTTNRPLLGKFVNGSYEEYLGRDFIEDLKTLSSDDVWLDVGSGQAIFAKDYFNTPVFPTKANVVAVTVSEPTRSPAEEIAFAQFEKAVGREKFRYLTATSARAAGSSCARSTPGARCMWFFGLQRLAASSHSCTPSEFSSSTAGSARSRAKTASAFMNSPMPGIISIS
ncbi:MAG: hypothetical protein ACXVCH_07255 [Bdellovibrionota bacterium]